MTSIPPPPPPEAPQGPPPQAARSNMAPWIVAGAIVLAGAIVAITLVLTSGGDEPGTDRPPVASVAPDETAAGYSEAFRTAFMDSCESTSGGQTEYCQCALDHLEANGPENESDITAEDQQAAIDACLDLVER